MSREADSPSRDDDDGELDSSSGLSRLLRTNDTTRATHTFSRRAALAGVGTVSLGAVAGCLGSIPGLDDSSGQQPVEPEDPGENPDATPGEFYHLVEEHDIVVDELYHTPDENRLDLFYDSSAETVAESDEEIAIIYQAYRELIDHGSPLENLYTEIVEPFDEQAKGWGIKTKWVTQYLDDEADENQVLGAIMQTKQFDGEDGNGDTQLSNESQFPTVDNGSSENNETSNATNAGDGESTSNESDGE